MIPALIGTGAVLFLAIIGAAVAVTRKTGKICERLARVETKLDTFQTKETCGQKRYKMLKTIHESRTNHEATHHEASAVGTGF